MGRDQLWIFLLGSHPLCDSRLFEYTSWETLRCDWAVDTAYLCWPQTAVRSRGGWRSVWTASWRSRGRRLAFFSLYIDTVMNAKFGEGAYTLSPHSNWDVWSQNLHNSLMSGLCCVFIIVSMSKLRNSRQTWLQVTHRSAHYRILAAMANSHTRTKAGDCWNTTWARKVEH